MRDDVGDELSLDRAPRSIVSLVPSLTELIVEWGLAPTLVGVTDYCVSPPGAFPDALRIRGTKNPDIGRIIELRPDLVLADQEENRRIDVDRLRAAGVAVWVTSVRSVRDVARSVSRLALVLGTPAEGAELSRRILEELDLSVVASHDGRRGGSFSVCMIWRDGAHQGDGELWWTVGADTYAGDLLRSSGLPPVPIGDVGRYPRATLAEVRDGSPELVLLPDEPYAFSDADADAFAGWSSSVLRCSGQPLFWWGHRTPGALRWLRDIRNDLDTGLRSGERAPREASQRVHEEDERVSVQDAHDHPR